MGGPPHHVQNLLVRDDLARVTGQDGQEIELPRREPDLLSVAHHATTGYVDLKSADPHHRRLAGALHPVAQRGPKPSHEFANSKRFVDEIVRPQIQRGNLLSLAFPG